MDLSRPISSVIPTLDGEVLTVLAGTTGSLTGRQVHRLARRGSQSGVSNVLVRLEKQGMVDVVAGGSANLYSLNRDHVAASAVAALVDLRGQLLRQLRSALAAWTVQPLAAALFGSAARGDGDVDSDIDLLLVRPDAVDEDDDEWAEAVAGLVRNAHRWTGNAVNAIEVSQGELAAMVGRGEAIVDELRRDAIELLSDPAIDLPTVLA